MSILRVSLSATRDTGGRVPDAWQTSGVEDALELAIQLGQADLVPGGGRTRELFETLATIAAHDLGAARAIEPHLDAIAILAQAGLDARELGGPNATWGVFAAEGRAPLTATGGPDSWVLSGTKQWCSLADRLRSALITATLDDGQRALFAVNLRHPGITIEPDAWRARGLAEIPSGPVSFSNVSAVRVGVPGWYLERSGFAWGGVSVAACWFGGAVGLARKLFAAIESRSEPDAIALMHLGAVDAQLQSARRALDEAARMIDGGEATSVVGNLLAKRVRATVVRAAEETITRVGHCLGPAPLAQSDEHAKRVADLDLYIKQHHAEKDDASLGSALLRDRSLPW
jgi:alkylation response protein AidB-like acyl-CoA dehydrogenase